MKLTILRAMLLASSALWAARMPAEEDPVPAWDAIASVKEFAAVPDHFPETERPPRLRLHGLEATEPAASVRRSGQGWVFRLQGRVPEVRAMLWKAALPDIDLNRLKDAGFFVVRYRCRGLRRERPSFAVLSLVGSDAAGKPVRVPLLNTSQAFNDGRWHVAVGRTALPRTATELEVAVRTADSRACFELGCCRFSADWPDVPEAFPQTPAGRFGVGPFRPIDLTSLCNDTLAAAAERVLKKHGLLTDGNRRFVADRILVGPVPFAVRTDGNNIVTPPNDPARNAGTVRVLGVDLPKRFYYREAREDRIVVPVSGRASEVCFLLAAELPPSVGRYALPDVPTQLQDINAFAVELVYDQGEPDRAFPYSIADEGHTIQRALAAYAVPADPNRQLKAVVFCNRWDGGDISLAALTLNTGSPVAIPPEVRNPAPYRVRAVPEPRRAEPVIQVRADRCVIANSHYRVLVDTQQGFVLRGLEHLRAPELPVRLGEGSGLQVEIDDCLWTGGDFRTRVVAVGSNAVTFALQPARSVLPLELQITLLADSSPELRFRATVRNAGPEPVRATIRLPVLDGLLLGEPADTWLYFPQCRNVLTCEPRACLAPNDRSFVMQFFDVFNPSAGVGVAWLTHNPQYDVIDYGLRKDAGGVTGFIQFPAKYHVWAPGQERTLTESSLVFHAGDWHAALKAYRAWLETWYRPVKGGGLEWWHESFLVRAHMTARSYSWTVPIFDPGENQYRIEAMMEEDRRYLQRLPDLVHLGGWCDYANEHQGDFHGGDYAVADYTGGPDNLRSAIRRLQALGIRASVYTIPDRVAKNSRIGRSIGPQIAQVRLDGQPLQDERVWYVCLAAEPWPSHYVEALERTVRELGLNAIYVDVFGHSRGDSCYSTTHGHEVPLNVERACAGLIRRVRQRIPEGVAVWSEFPLTDLNSRYGSGNITYYFLTLHEYLAPSYDRLDRAPLFSPPGQSVHRFVFPHLKQFGFPVGFEGSLDARGLQFLFFNGEGLYDVGFLLYDSRDLPRIRRWLAIQKAYADCFTTAAPKPLIQTEAGQVYANAFPGRGRTVWTLYNGRFATYRGPVLSVPHQSGATYRDLWHGCELQPVIRHGHAILCVPLDPQGIGCVLQTLPPGDADPTEEPIRPTGPAPGL